MATTLSSVCRLVDDPPALEHVVDEDEPAGTHAQEDLLVVAGIAGLVGVDEREVELLLLRQRPQGVDARADAKVDPVGDAGAFPRFAAIAVHSSLTSQQRSRPSGPRPRATASAE